MSLKQEISKILVKWGMPTRQVVINEIVALYELQKKKTKKSGQKRKKQSSVVGKLPSKTDQTG